jgi:hypothetical protein
MRQLEQPARFWCCSVMSIRCRLDTRALAILHAATALRPFQDDAVKARKSILEGIDPRPSHEGGQHRDLVLGTPPAPAAP